MAHLPDDSFDFIDEVSDPEPSTGKAWLVGIGIALLLVGYGAICLYAGHGWTPIGLRRDRFADREVFGREAHALGWALIILGLFIHVNWYWTYHKYLSYVAPIARVLAIIAFILCMGWFAMLRVRIG